MPTWTNRVPAVLFGAATMAIVQTEFSVAALTPTKINKIAEEITVIIDGQYPGSGVIIDRAGRTYTVLTAYHVVETEDEYTIITGDGKEYPVNYETVVPMPGVDLAVIQFLSSEDYKVAELGDSDRMTIASSVYIGGFPKPGREITQVTYQFTSGEITAGLIYDNFTRAGMSGGPVLDENGRLVGIHGRAETDAQEAGDESQQGGAPDKIGLNLGIPINTFFPFAEEIGLNLVSTAKVPSVPPETPTLTPPIQPPPENNSRPPIPLPDTEVVVAPTTPSLSYDNLFLAKTLESRTNAIAVHPDGDTIITGSGNQIKIWDRRKGKLTHTFKEHRKDITAIAISPDGDTFATASKDDTIKIWSWPQGKVVKTIDKHQKNVNAIAFSPNGQEIVSGSDDKTVRIWQIPTGQSQAKINIDSPVHSVAFSPDGTTIVSASREGKIQLWDVDSQELIDVITDHTSTVNSIAISPDGNTIVSGSSDRTIRIWDITNLETIEPIGKIQLERHVFVVSISPDGQTIASATDKNIRLWELETGKLVNDLGEGSLISFSPDGRTVVDNVIRIWRVPGR